MIYGLILMPLMLLAFTAMLFVNKRQALNRVAFMFVSALILIAGLRSGTGTDTLEYISIWNGIKPLDLAWSQGTGMEYLEPGFRYSISFLRIFTDAPAVFLLTMASITLGYLYYGLYQIPKTNIFFALALYLMIFYMPYTLNAMRQAVAMSIFICTLPHILTGNFKKTLVWALAATLFHFTGLLILVAFLIARIRTGLIKFVFLGLVLSLLIYYLKLPGRFFDLILYNKFSIYADNWGQVEALQVLLRFFILASFIFSAKYIYKEYWFSSLIKIYSVGFFLYIALADASMVAARFNMFFRILEIVLFSVIISVARKYHNKFLFYLIASVLGFYIYYLNTMNPDNIYSSIL